MTQYIDKSALAVKLEKYYKEYLKKAKTFVDDSNYLIGKADAYHYMLTILDTLEVKEVDLNKEIKKYSMELAMKENNGDWEKDIAVTAKYFFELGLKTKQ